MVSLSVWTDKGSEQSSWSHGTIKQSTEWSHDTVDGESAQPDGALWVHSTQAVETAKGMKHIKAYYCKICGRACKWPSDLEKHLRIHTGDRPYQCGVCGKRFVQKSHINTHMTTHRRRGEFENVN